MYMNGTMSQLLYSVAMWFTEAASMIYFSVSCLLALVIAVPDDSQYIYMKSVRCKHNPRLLRNVSCFAKSYSRTISKANIMGVLTEPLTSVMVCICTCGNFGKASQI